MASSLQTTAILSSSSCYSLRAVNASIHVPKPPRVSYSVPKVPTRKMQQIEEFNGSIDTTPLEKNVITTQIYDGVYNNPNIKPKATVQLYAILEEVADRIEMHSNLVQQRDNWNNLLLNSINMMTLTATAMAGFAATSGGDSAPLFSLNLSSALLFSAATGMSLVMNKIQPSQLAEEQRNATRLFRKLQTQIQTTIALGNPTEEDVKGSTEKVLALDKAYPLPLLGVMLDKFPAKFEPAVWWPSTQFQRENKTHQGSKVESKNNGWSKELEMELREVIEVIKRKDAEDYERLGNIVLKINKTLAIAGPLLTGIAAVGSSFVGNGSLAAIVPVMAGSLAAAVNAFEHGGQVGMIFEMYRNCGGFFKLLEETIEATLDKDLDKRENGELFEMKVATQLGRSVSELRQLASKSTSYRVEGIAIDEFASKLF
ncbi:probable F-box protein At4g22030 [Gastrolobium bilobum]|uniref:probable F-box protein At4g22030 n=1 Tax=Gastrolobium bilobum TaxID=150636 RepID=UPI002AB276BA|nr:probable F-box protein At4g22030 [Gastrolobium bilobum]